MSNQRYEDEIRWRNDAINCLIRAINGLELNVDEQFLPDMVQEAIETVRSQRHTVLILSARQILEAAEFAGLDVCVDPVNDELDEEYCIRPGTIAGCPQEGLEPYEGLLIESLLYPEEGAVPLSGEQPFKEYEPVIDEGFLRQAAKCNGWAGELARRLLDENMRKSELVMLIKRLGSSLRSARPECKLPDTAMLYLSKHGLISVNDCLRTSLPQRIREPSLYQENKPL
ncbi:hypothetical protein O3355_002096 [Salmonella enterica subsp. enterica serovar Braenderup]|uniref:hypothetical protein n=1 Tax=Salmonella enterica TaxID=28901 RepID=UPI00070F8A23|nr:hypothetical protein [Salmonella enterica]ECJ3933802.1 hypothetical protein [Salmonella enterica subsp. enterica]EDR6297493.1 hypothetical protein [Salmonella enterica subsp. enterica serovar Berkeley]EHW7283703.1 hypothetical protein [Salmonella enterica subsp. enterica serovar Bispebjerg]EKG5889101.1 hypothetical protein [Salmonella enterica subsp. enterica serovar Braenderup]HEC8255114.1 hypothetical protein [Salmonella enterica subsp. enterica serovar Montevideo]HED0310121.1 hypothetic